MTADVRRWWWQRIEPGRYALCLSPATPGPPQAVAWVYHLDGGGWCARWRAWSADGDAETLTLATAKRAAERAALPAGAVKR